MRATGDVPRAWLCPHSGSPGNAEGINRLVGGVGVGVGVRETGESRGRAEIPAGTLESPVSLQEVGGLGRG